MSQQPGPSGALNANSGRRPQPQITPDNRLSYFCFECQDEFKIYCLLNQHTPYYHSGVHLPCCSACNQTFPTMTQRNQHMQLHNITYQCPTCSGFIGHLQYDQHIREHSQGAIQWGHNTVCDAVNSPLTCLVQECGMQFTEREELYNHTKLHHYQCVFRNCGKMSTNYLKYFTHIKIHKLRMNCCHSCGIWFRSRDEVDRHYLQNHVKTTAPHQCYLCGWKCLTRRILKSHILTYHPKPQ